MPGLSGGKLKDYERLRDKWNSDPERMTDDEIARFKAARELDPEWRANREAEKAAKAADKIKELQQRKEAEEKKMRDDIAAIKDQIQNLTAK